MPLITPDQKKSTRPTDYVFLIDNSASIEPEERIIIRESAKLFIDFSQLNDRLSIVLFGKGAEKVLTQTILSEQDRITAKQQIDTGINFDEQFSDLYAGIKLIAEQKAGLFREKEAEAVIVILSDGKLEPHGLDAKVAYQGILHYLSSDLGNIPFFTIGLGTTSIHHNFIDNPNVSGLVLLRDILAGPNGQFYWARQIDDLFQIYLEILNRTKNFSEGVFDKGIFKVDESIESITAIVRKRKSGGEILCRTEDMVIRDPKGNEIDFLRAPGAYAGATDTSTRTDMSTRIVWKNDYEYFDLIMIQKPFPGIWKIGRKNENPLENGKSLEILSRVVAHIDLEHTIQPVYYLGGEIEWRAWLFDDRTKEIAVSDYQLMMKCETEENFNNVNQYTEMKQASEDKGIYLLRYPDDFNTLSNGFNTSPKDVNTPPKDISKLPKDISTPPKDVNTLPKPGRYQVQVMAQKKSDQFFIRRSLPISVTLKEAFLTFHTFHTSVRPKQWILPWQKPHLKLSVDLHKEAKSFPSTTCSTKIFGEIQHWDDSGKPEQGETIELSPAGPEGNTYIADYLLTQSGFYTFRYKGLFTFTDQPNLSITSPIGRVEVISLVFPIVAAFIFLFLIIFYLALYTSRKSLPPKKINCTVTTLDGKPINAGNFKVKGKGRVSISGPKATPSVMQELRQKEVQRLRQKEVQDSRPKEVVILYLQARPNLFLKRRVFIGVSQGSVKNQGSPLHGEALVNRKTRITFESGENTFELRFP